ncbi:NAD(P)/FAD-dependent oxidoreductase [Rossellomorea sp. SC111]|uniref:NAD(P)/FAD-dependent oxidoreductase n=1 Tax=Rossellomorea sp. SC111 TaxID=2968985 RepID=UPI00215AF3CC|nr:NAD(P)/FAD-dependent oxidoreductase [Rossellomorea sp. SC111]MCR8846782.1 NAD(P)/FAD-dependent oxidoreductase [Rossellomorea sp. SC111]
MDNSVIVIGGGIGGLTAAALLGSAGYHVQVLEASREWGGCAGKFQRGKALFPVGATLGMGFENGGIHQRIFQYLGIELPSNQLLDRVMDIHLPGVNLTFHRNRETHVKGLIQSFPDIADEIGCYFKDLYSMAKKIRTLVDSLPILPPKTVREWKELIMSLNLSSMTLLPAFQKTMLDLLKKYDLHVHPSFKHFIDGQLIDSMQVESDQCSLLFGCLALDMYHEGAFYLEGGLYRIAECLVDASESVGVKATLGRKVVGITRDERNQEWIVSDHRGKDYRANHIVCNVPVQSLKDLFPPQYAPKFKNYIKGKERASLWGTMTLYMLLKEESLPEGLPLFSQICTSPDGNMTEGDHLFLSLSHPDDRKRAPEGFRTVTVSTHTRLENWDSKEKYDCYKRTLKKKMLDSIELVIPSIRSNLIQFYPGAPKAWERYTGRPGGIVGGFPQTNDHALFNSLSHRTPLENIWVCGDSVFPGAGTIGVSVSGYHVFHSITGKKLPT